MLNKDISGLKQRLKFCAILLRLQIQDEIGLAAVEQADALVSQLVTRLTDVFARERSALEGQWTKGENVSTEDLRIALTRYRSFFHRLLSM